MGTTEINIKEALIAIGIAEQETKIQDLQANAQQLQNQINDYGQNKDRYDSFRTKLTRSKEQILQQQALVSNAIKALKELNLEKKTCVEHGSVVITDKQRFFICIGLGKINYQEKDYFFISIAAPIFEAMRNKKEGDHFVFNKMEHCIKKII